MPGVQLPLNIFEPRYLSMVIDALASDHLLGMIQPTSETMMDEVPAAPPDRLRRTHHLI